MRIVGKIVSAIISLIPESDFKNYLRCRLYNLHQNHFKIHFRHSLFHVSFDEFNLIFEQNPFHLLMEQQQYNRYYSLKKGDVVIDAGGFWGTYALYAAKTVGATGKVFVFEPDSTNRKQLISHLKLNDLNNITLINKGLWDKEDSLPFNSSGGLGSSFAGAEEDSEHIDVTSIDIALEELDLKKIDFIKMDIEGAEIEAIRGAENTLKKGTNLAIASYHIVDGQSTYITLEKILEGMNYATKTDKSPEIITFSWSKKP